MNEDFEKNTASVKIKLNLPGRKEVNLQLSENKFSFILSTILISSFWGLLSTGLLLYVLWNGKLQNTEELPEKKNIAADLEKNVEPLVSKEKNNSPPVSKISKAQESNEGVLASYIDPIPEKNALDLGRGLIVSNFEIKKQKRILTLNFQISNTENNEKKGYIWAIAHFKKANGSTIVAYSSYMAEINSNGYALNPNRGSPFAIRTHKFQELNIPELHLQSAELIKITFGAYLQNDKNQVTAELKVIDSLRSQAPSTMVFPKTAPIAH